MYKLKEGFEVHNTLNKDLYSNLKLKPEIRERLLDIVGYFVHDYLDFEIPVLDVHLVGSNASFNYTDTSDIDLHIITNFEMINDIGSDKIQTLFNLEKASFNASYNIFIKGREVELYIEDVNASAISNGVYSIFNDSWIKFPSPISAKKLDTSKDLADYVERIDAALDSNSSVEVQNMINDIYNMRKTSLIKDGEYGYGNQLFKDIRSIGKLDELKDKFKEFKSYELTLEEYDYGKLY